MASSSMCGPANPLQQLKTHSALDRSIHHDRLRPSSSPSSSSQFRHQPQGLAQPNHEFDQFLSSSPSASSSLHPVALPALPQKSWAADFQNLHISAPPPAAAAAPVHASPALAGWGAEFLSQMSTSPAPMRSVTPQPQSALLSGPATTYNMGMMNSGYLQTPSFPTTLHPMMDFPQREVPQPLSELQTEQLKPEEIPQEAAQDARDSEHDADELARTAGQLVDTLSQDTSRKFQDSQFVALMRKLRDKTVKVEDGKMVEV
ncbi:hypothetical protein ABW21_db0208686 [Orbilia brochopaga]|nr:hypothetical protein ABW21_db0208686 [Drechslerella brochopaga]